MSPMNRQPSFASPNTLPQFPWSRNSKAMNINNTDSENGPVPRSLTTLMPASLGPRQPPRPPSPPRARATGLDRAKPGRPEPARPGQALRAAGAAAGHSVLRSAAGDGWRRRPGRCSGSGELSTAESYARPAGSRRRRRDRHRHRRKPVPSAAPCDAAEAAGRPGRHSPPTALAPAAGQQGCAEALCSSPTRTTSALLA